MARRFVHRRRRRSRWPAVLGLLAILLAGLWVGMPWLVGWLARDQLQALGFPRPELRVTSIGAHEARVSAVSLGEAGELGAEEIVLAYAPLDLLERRIERVRVRGLRLALDLSGGRPTFGSLEAPLRAMTEGGGASFPVPPVELEAAALRLATPIGVVETPFHGTVGREGSGFTAEFDLTAASELGGLAGHLHARIGDDGNVDARLALAEGSIRLSNGAVGAIAGDIAVKLVPGRLPDVSAQLDLADLSTGSFAFPKGRIALEVAAERASGRIHLGEAGEPLSLEASATVEDLSGAPRLAASLDLAIDAAAPLWGLLAIPAPTVGSARLQGTASGDLPPLDQFDLAGLAALTSERPIHGNVRADLSGLAWQGIVSGLSAAGACDVEVEGGAVALSAPAEWIVEGQVEAALVETLALPPEIAVILAKPLSLSLGPPLQLRLLRDETGTGVAGKIALALAAADGAKLQGSLEGRSTINEAGGLAELQIDQMTAKLSGVTVAGTRIGALALSGSVAGTPSALAGAVGVDASLPSLAAGDLKADAVGLKLGLDIDLDNGILTAGLREPSRLTFKRLAGPGFSLRPTRELILLPGETDPLLRLDLADPAGPTLAHEVAIAKMAGQATIGSQTVALDVPKLSFSGSLLGAGGYRGRARLEGGTAKLPDIGIAGSGVSAEAAFGQGGLSDAKLKIAVLTSQDTPAAFAPLGLDATAKSTPRGIDFSGRLADPAKRLSLEASGRHDPTTGQGSARLELKPIQFAQGRVQPVDLFPAAGQSLRNVEGSVALAGDLGWKGDRVTSNLKLAVRDLSMEAQQAHVSRVNGVIAFDSLAPLTTPANQQIAVALIEAGLPMTDGVLTFRIEPGPILAIADAHLTLAGGQVSLDPVRLARTDTRQELRLGVDGVDLGALLALADIEGASGAGRMSGHIPVTIEAGDFVISKGELNSDGPGVLKYKPAKPPSALQSGGETVSLALSALSNFQYSKLRLNLDRQAGGEMVVAMHITGKNPEFYKGYPVEFNLTVTGKLEQILRQSLTGYRIPDVIRKNLQGFEKQ